jgi:hypothetical protein
MLLTVEPDEDIMQGKVRLIAQVPEDYPHEFMGAPFIGAIGNAIEDGRCPLERIAVAFDPAILGEKPDSELCEPDGTILLFLDPTLLEEVK